MPASLVEVVFDHFEEGDVLGGGGKAAGAPHQKGRSQD